LTETGFKVKIGVLSDTHIDSLEAGNRMAQRLLSEPFRNVEMILHAGDHVITDLDVCFDGIAFYGVCGNMDSADSFLPQRRIIEVDRYRIGMTHGWGAVYGIEQRVLDSFADQKIDVLIFGHSHLPVCRQVGSVLLLNPGSATDCRSAPFHTVAVLELGATVQAEIIAID